MLDAEAANALLEKAPTRGCAAVAVLRNLKQSDLSEVAKYANPPAGVKLVIEAMCVMKGVQPKRKPGEGVVTRVMVKHKPLPLSLRKAGSTVFSKNMSSDENNRNILVNPFFSSLRK